MGAYQVWFGQGDAVPPRELAAFAAWRASLPRNRQGRRILLTGDLEARLGDVEAVPCMTGCRKWRRPAPTRTCVAPGMPGPVVADEALRVPDALAGGDFRMPAKLYAGTRRAIDQRR